MQKKLFFMLLAFLALSFAACDTKSSGKCHITGSIPEKYNGKRIFLVPTVGDNRYNVDSVVIQNGKFEFNSDTLMLAEIRVDYHFRLGLQPLLLVVEPGEVTVRVDSISSAVGTPQNDSLNVWKERKQVHDQEYRQMIGIINELREKGDTAQANQLKPQAHDYHMAFKTYTRNLAKNMKEGILHDFLSTLYPKTYKRMMPDSTTVEYDADTNEPIHQ